MLHTVTVFYNEPAPLAVLCKNRVGVTDFTGSRTNEMKDIKIHLHFLNV